MASCPRTREAIDALPYRIEYGHWGMTAWVGGGWGNPGKMLAQAFFPVGNCGPYDPPEVQDRVFTELDAAARLALAEAA